jgi:hypothetical protein
MPRLQVGDIQIDGTKVVIGGQPMDGSRPAPAPTPPPGSPLRWVDRLPISASALVAIGAVLAVAGAAANMLYAAWADPVGALVHGGFLAPVGVGAIGAGVVKAWMRRNPAVRYRAELGHGAEQFISTLRPLLSIADPRNTVAHIAARTGWPEQRVVASLALLRERGELREELDLDTGQFFYQTVPNLPAPRNLDSRLGDLTP